MGTWFGSILGYLLFQIPSVVLAALALSVVLRHYGVRARLFWVIGSYIVLVGGLFALAVFGRDEFGYSAIPLLINTAEWCLLTLAAGLEVPTAMAWLFGGNFFATVMLGMLLNIAIFVLIDRVRYPKANMKI